MADIDHYNIPVYNFPYDVEEDDEETIADNSELRVGISVNRCQIPTNVVVQQALLPFAIVGSEEEIEVGGEMVRARRYPWGIVEVDNPQHSDFGRLRSALLNTHLTDLKEITHDFLYENYRTEKLSRGVNGSGGDHDASNSSILPEDLATQSVRLKEEQLRREGPFEPFLSDSGPRLIPWLMYAIEDKLREMELKNQREISEKRQELLAKEESLRNLEIRLAQAQQLSEANAAAALAASASNGNGQA